MVPRDDTAIKEKCMNFVRSTATTPDGEGYEKIEGTLTHLYTTVIYWFEYRFLLA